MILDNIYSFFYGLLVSLTSFSFFYILGFVSLPRSFIRTSFFPAFVGAAIFSLMMWYGIQWHISLDHIFLAVFFLALVFACFRIQYLMRHLDCRVASLRTMMRQVMTSKVIKSIAFWLGAYILLYGLITLFLPLPDTKKYLPLTWINNFDLFNYINVTQSLISPTPDAYWGYYYQTPAVFYFDAWVSLFYYHNAMSAAMPIMYSVAATVGLMIVFYCHHFFSCPRKIALCIAAVMLCGSFYRYLIGVYFLSSLMGMIVWLAFLSEILISYTYMTAQLTWRSYFQNSLILFIYGGLLFLLYPIFFAAMPIVYCAMIGLMIFFSEKPWLWRVFLKKETIAIIGLLTALACLILLLPGYAQKAVYNLSEFSHRLGVIGFSLISPAAMLGFPYFFEQTSQNVVMLTLAFIFCVAVFLYALRAARLWAGLEIQPAAYTLLFLLLGSFVVYFIYYAIEGPTRYQPWKFSTYFVLPLMGLFWALAFRLKPSEKGVIVLAVFCIASNFFWIRFPPSAPLSKNYQQLSALNNLPGHEIFIKMSTKSSTFLSVFFVRNKHLNLLSNSALYYPRVSENDVPKKSLIFRESKHCTLEEIRLISLGCLSNT